MTAIQLCRLMFIFAAFGLGLNVFLLFTIGHEHPPGQECGHDHGPGGHAHGAHAHGGCNHEHDHGHDHGHTHAGHAHGDTNKKIARVLAESKCVTGTGSLHCDTALTLVISAEAPEQNNGLVVSRMASCSPSCLELCGGAAAPHDTVQLRFRMLAY